MTLENLKSIISKVHLWKNQILFWKEEILYSLTLFLKDDLTMDNWEIKNYELNLRIYD